MSEYKLYESGLSIPEVSKKTGIARSTLRFRFKNKGILRGRSDAVRMAGKKGRLGGGFRGKKRIFTKEHKKNISKAKLGKGKGTRITSNGYFEYTMGEHKGRLVHVVIIEKRIGRRLYSNECGHHKDENKQNNDPNNLDLMTKSEHMRLHALKNNHLRKRDKKGRYK